SLAATGVDAVSFGATSGPLGIVHHAGDGKTPYYDGRANAVVYPAYHVVAGLTRGAGARLVAATSSDEARVRCLAYRTDGATLLWLANMTAQVQTASVAPVGADAFGMVLDEGSFEQATTAPAAFQAAVKPIDTSRVLLRGYAVALICLADA